MMDILYLRIGKRKGLNNYTYKLDRKLTLKPLDDGSSGNYKNKTYYQTKVVKLKVNISDDFFKIPNNIIELKLKEIK